MKYAWIDKQHEFTLTDIWTVLDVSVSGYRSWKRGGKPDRQRLSDARMLALIQTIHAEFKWIYGSPRMVRELRGRGFPASKKRVERLVHENDIRARHKRRYKVTTGRMTADIVTDALTMAWFRKKPTAGVLHHSDRGSQ